MNISIRKMPDGEKEAGKGIIDCLMEMERMEHYFTELPSDEKKQYQKVLTAIQNNEASVRLSVFSGENEITKVVSAVGYDHPELFYVNFKEIRYMRTPMGTIYQIEYLIKETVRKDAINSMKDRINTVIEELNIKENDSEMIKCRKIHNYLIEHVSYCYEAINNLDQYPRTFDIRGVFEDSRAVCEGIAKAFKVLADRVGLNCFIAGGMAAREGFENKIPHAWNIVKTGKTYSHIDVTWDIGMSETSGRKRYDYFMIPDEWIREDHDYSNLPECQESRYSYFVQKQCVFNGIQLLKAYLEKEIEGKRQLLYFKVVGKNGMPDDIVDRIHKLIFKMVSENSTAAFSLVILTNQKQKIFFVRIKK